MVAKTEHGSPPIPHHLLCLHPSGASNTCASNMVPPGLYDECGCCNATVWGCWSMGVGVDGWMDGVSIWGADPWDTGAEALNAYGPCQLCL